MCSSQVNGDVFIGRYFDNEDDFKRLDFTASELSSSAPWLAEANKQLMRRSERSGDTQALLQRLQQQGQQPVAAAGDGQPSADGAQSPADAEKSKGNQVGLFNPVASLVSSVGPDGCTAATHQSPAETLTCQQGSGHNNASLAILQPYNPNSAVGFS